MSRLFRPCLVEDRERLDFEWLIRRLVADLGLHATIERLVVDWSSRLSSHRLTPHSVSFAYSASSLINPFRASHSSVSFPSFENQIRRILQFAWTSMPSTQESRPGLEAPREGS